MTVDTAWVAGVAITYVGLVVAFCAVVMYVGWRERRRPQPLRPLPAPVVSLDLERARRARAARRRAGMAHNSAAGLGRAADGRARGTEARTPSPVLVSVPGHDPLDAA